MSLTSFVKTDPFLILLSLPPIVRLCPGLALISDARATG